MTIYDTPVIRAPFAIAAGAADLRFDEILNPGNATTESFALSTYINKGETGTGAPTDFIDQFNTVLAAAAASLGLAVPTATLNTEGRVAITSSLMRILWSDGASTFDRNILGFNPISTTVLTFGSLGPFQADLQWYPGIYAVFDSAELERRIVREGRTQLGRPVRINHNEDPWTERLLDFSQPGIAAARMIQGRSDLAAFAAVAAPWVQGDDNTWEKLFAYLVGPFGPNGDNQIYVYSTNDPLTHTQTGPYEVILDESEPGLGEVRAGGFITSRSSEYYPVRLMLWRGPS